MVDRVGWAPTLLRPFLRRRSRAARACLLHGRTVQTSAITRRVNFYVVSKGQTRRV